VENAHHYWFFPGSKQTSIGWRRLSELQSIDAHRNHGFTLIELMVVLVIIGIMTAVIIPEMRGTYQDARLRAASRDLVNVFDVAASRAVSFNQIHRVHLDVRAGKYLVEKRVRGDDRGGDQFQPLKDIPGSEGTWDKRISVEVHDPSEAPPETAEGPGEAPAPASEPAAPEPPPPAATAEDTITFYPDGTADSREIQLRDPDGFRIGLRINPTTGRIHIIELDRR